MSCPCAVGLQLLELLFYCHCAEWDSGDARDQVRQTMGALCNHPVCLCIFCPVLRGPHHQEFGWLSQSYPAKPQWVSVMMDVP